MIDMNNTLTTIYLATDHAGFTCKETVKNYLLSKEYNIIDCGADTYEEGDDYPDYISRAAKEVSRDKNARGIIFGGSGEGEAIVANRFPHVRATVCYGGTQAIDIAKISRMHNDSNIISIGARYIDQNELLLVIQAWLDTEFSGDERHMRRIDKIDKLQV